MKKRILIAFAKGDKVITKISGLFLCLILSLNLSGQKIHTLQVESWIAGNWMKSSLQTFTYDGSNFLTNVLTQSWDAINLIWKDSFRTNYNNNPDGTVNVMVTQSWDGVSTWNNVSQTTYTYNGAKKVLTATTQIWLVSVWQNTSLQTNTYDGSGFLINTLNQTWLISLWQNSARIKYSNNPNGTVNIDTTQIWDGVSTWKNSERSTYTYNGSNQVLTDATDTLESGIWQATSLSTNTYGSGHLTHSLIQQWDKGSTSYINESQSNYTNNTDGTPSVIINQLWDKGAIDWVNSLRMTFTYYPPTRIQELKSEESLTLYPNPAGDKIAIKVNISIHGSAYSITDQSGKLVLQGRLINDNGTIDISKLANGIYFLRIEEKNQHSYKLIKNQ